MTEEEKQLLLQDLCARLPYGVIVQYKGHNTIIKNKLLTGSDLDCNMEYYKPYLRPRSEIANLISAKEFTQLSGIDLIDWYNANHIDYRGLIPMGLALEALEGMYETEKQKD